MAKYKRKIKLISPGLQGRIIFSFLIVAIFSVTLQLIVVTGILSRAALEGGDIGSVSSGYHFITFIAAENGMSDPPVPQDLQCRVQQPPPPVRNPHVVACHFAHRILRLRLHNACLQPLPLLVTLPEYPAPLPARRRYLADQPRRCRSARQSL